METLTFYKTGLGFALFKWAILCYDDTVRLLKLPPNTKQFSVVLCPTDKNGTNVIHRKFIKKAYHIYSLNGKRLNLTLDANYLIRRIFATHKNCEYLEIDVFNIKTF
jgi:hypothetical protein